MSKQDQAGLQIYNALLSAFTPNQARYLMSEIGRENGWNLDTIYKGHPEPVDVKRGVKNPRYNFGLISWQGQRRIRLVNMLASRGLFRDGKPVRSQATLEAMAQFMKNEMRGYKGANEFLNNPNPSYDWAKRAVGRDYILWRYDDKAYATGHTVRDSYFKQINKLTGGYNGVVPTGRMYSLSDDVMFIGDSIAHGYRSANSAAGLTEVGASPSRVLQQVKRTIEVGGSKMRGMPVVLSTGLSNNPQDLASVEEQIRLLRQAGAQVTVLGVANNYNLHGAKGGDINNALSTIASRYGSRFNGGFNAGKDGVHPQSYQGLVVYGNEPDKVGPYKAPNYQTAPVQVASTPQLQQPMMDTVYKRAGEATPILTDGVNLVAPQDKDEYNIFKGIEQLGLSVADEANYVNALTNMNQLEDSYLNKPLMTNNPLHNKISKLFDMVSV